MKVFSEYREVKWSDEPLDVEELILMSRLSRGDVSASVELMALRSNGVLLEAYIRKASQDTWSKWFGEMRAGMDKTQAPRMANEIQENLRRQIQLPPGVELRVIPSENPVRSNEGDAMIRRLLGELDNGENKT